MDRGAIIGRVQTRVVLEGGWGRRPQGGAPQIGSFRALGSVAVAASTPGGLILSPARKSGCRATGKSATKCVSSNSCDTASELIGSIAVTRIARLPFSNPHVVGVVVS